MNCFYHNYLFFFGVIYYLIFPVWIVMLGGFYNYPGMDHVYYYYDENIVGRYWLYVILLLLSFWAGSISPLKFQIKANDNKKEYIISSRDVFLFSLPLFLYAQILILRNSQNLFKGYKVDYDTQFMGSIASISTFFLFFYLYTYRSNRSYSKKINLYFLISIIEFSVVLLGLGSRMYVLLPCITYVLFFKDIKKTSLKKLLIVAGCTTIFFLFIGVWRLGGDISLEQILYIGMTEPEFTWISAASMFFREDLPLLAFPYNFLSSFFNFIPSVLFPDKHSFIYPINIDFVNPLGATSLIVSLISNFGILGSLVVVYLGGFFLTCLRINGKTLFSRTYYYCICGILPFQLFRDSFQIVNKMIFYNYLLLPLLIFFCEKILCSKYSKRNDISS